MRSSMLKGSRRWRSLRRCLMVVVFGLLTFGTNNEATRIETFETTFQLSIKKDEGLQYWTDLSLKPEEKSPRSICAGFMILVKQCYAFLAANLAGCKDGFFAYDDSGIQGNLSIYIIQFQIRPTTLDAWREHIEDTFLKLAHEHLEQANSGSSKGTSKIQLKGMRMFPVEALEVSAKVKSSNGEPPDVYKKDLTNDLQLIRSSTPVHDIRIERNSVSRSNYHSVYVYLDVYRMSKLVPEIVSQTNQVFKLEDWLQEMQVLVAFGYQKDLWIWRSWVQAHKVCFGPYQSTN
ncbi:unnamed protein product [Dicrocoelium dendriticum]|nr:unnamed protein product [Dicrocoelium dendriticum]CAH8643802.1 unnamed protein product [Dicrocoelium dendriticum]